ncbi:MAG: hypothetical protein OEY67_07645 [Gammaproteobacteria bacterium]|nr:hypothetical protein [Gammaproteobacteria bacterium]
MSYTYNATLNFVGCPVSVQLNHPSLTEVLHKTYSALEVAQRPSNLHYVVSLDSGTGIMSLEQQGGSCYQTRELGELVFLLEKEATISIQSLRRDLYFVHSAALEHLGKGIMIVAASGTGKSTTAWALLKHGFHYLSDELAPIDISDMSIQPYPHAICLKARPPKDYPLPADILSTSSTLHVPAYTFAESVCHQPVTLSAIFFLDYQPGLSNPTVTPISSAETSARLYANTLNQLAHEDDGLAAAVAIARHVPGYSLVSADLGKTCQLLNEVVVKL